jgi:hypothetical protein
MSNPEYLVTILRNDPYGISAMVNTLAPRTRSPNWIHAVTVPCGGERRGGAVVDQEIEPIWGNPDEGYPPQSAS